MERGGRMPPVGRLAGELRRALASGELIPYFQPLIGLDSGRVIAVEALCRWRHPTLGVLSPDRFIEAAERVGLIAELGRVMLRESARRAADWHRRGIAVGLSLNVSPSELRPEFAEETLAILGEHELPPSSLTLEITESPGLLDSPEEALALRMLRDEGVGVAVDDFGAGTTSFETLRRLSFTEVKIDRSLLHDDRQESEDLVAECVGLAHERSAVVVAEGIETSADLSRARRWGCDRAQGFYFSPAVPADELEALLARS